MNIRQCLACTNMHTRSYDPFCVVVAIELRNKYWHANFDINYMKFHASAQPRWHFVPITSAFHTESNESPRNRHPNFDKKAKTKLGGQMHSFHIETFRKTTRDFPAHWTGIVAFTAYLYAYLMHYSYSVRPQARVNSKLFDLNAPRQSPAKNMHWHSPDTTFMNIYGTLYIFICLYIFTANMSDAYVAHRIRDHAGGMP